MSLGGVFKIISNDGKADRMIMATSMLNQRIKEIIGQRIRAGKADIVPTLVDIERTHILYVNAHFKPYAAIAYEYNKVRPQNGSISFGNSMQFSIPQFGDFFYDMTVRLTLPQISGSEVRFPTTYVVDSDIDSNENDNPFAGIVWLIYDGTLITQNSSSSNTAISATTHSNVFPHLRGNEAAWVGIKYQFVDFLGVPYPVETTPNLPNTGLPLSTLKTTNLVRYCEYPGNFLFKQTSFSVNGNPLDQYSNVVTVISEKFDVPVNKRYGYNVLNGQQNVLTGTGSMLRADLVDTEFQQNIGLLGGQINGWDKLQIGQAVAAFNTTGGTANYNRTGNNGTTALNAISSQLLANPNNATSGQSDICQSVIQVTDGPQTPKPSQPTLEIWQNLSFWFNKCVGLAIPSVAIPYGQRFITINIADLQSSNLGNLVYEVPTAYLKRTIYYNSQNPNVVPTLSTVDTIVEDFTPWGLGPLGRRPGYPLIDFTYAITNNLNSSAQINAELYINNIFVNPEIHDIYIKRIGFSLIRVYREQYTSLAGQSNAEILLSALKWPIEYMFVGVQPTWNLNSVQNPNAWRDWHLFSRNITARPKSLRGGNYSESVPSAVTGQVLTYIGQSSIPADEYWVPARTSDLLSVVSHGISLFDNNPSSFYNSYLPWKYGNDARNTSIEDNSVLFINFALFPGEYQPSGHLNISRARETYVNISSAYIASNGKANFFVTASAINFLLISDGSAVLRYST